MLDPEFAEDVNRYGRLSYTSAFGLLFDLLIITLLLELSLWNDETLRNADYHFEIILATGKAGGINVRRILDYFVPSFLRWNLLFVGKKVSEHQN